MLNHFLLNIQFLFSPHVIFVTRNVDVTSFV